MVTSERVGIGTMLKADFSLSYNACIFYKETASVYFICNRELFLKEPNQTEMLSFLLGDQSAGSRGEESWVSSHLEWPPGASALEMPMPRGRQSRGKVHCGNSQNRWRHQVLAAAAPVHHHADDNARWLTNSSWSKSHYTPARLGCPDFHVRDKESKA